MIARCLLGLVLVGCAPRQPPPEPPEPAPADGHAAIVGRVLEVGSSLPLAGALVILQCACLSGQREVMSDEAGRYRFGGLPGGKYTVQVLYGQANVNKSMDVPAGAGYRADFSVDPEASVYIGCSFDDLRSIDRSLFHDFCDGRPTSPPGCRYGAPPQVVVTDLR
jgi:hypothetical protein